jgi:hypothetical protein
MRDINRIKSIIKDFEKLWLENPDFRIGQLFMGITKTEVSDPKLFYMEDEEFSLQLEEFKNSLNDNKKKTVEK